MKIYLEKKKDKNGRITYNIMHGEGKKLRKYKKKIVTQNNSI